jgi:hypothetical protein
MSRTRTKKRSKQQEIIDSHIGYYSRYQIYYVPDVSNYRKFYDIPDELRDYTKIDDVTEMSIERINLLRQYGNIVYIGITNDIDARFEEHKEVKQFDTMHLICFCNGIDHTKRLEKNLIDYFIPPYNKVRGGGGVKWDQNWIYALLD